MTSTSNIGRAKVIRMQMCCHGVLALKQIARIELPGDGKGSRPAYTFLVVRELHSKSAITGQEEPKDEELLGSQQWTPLQLRTSQMADRSISRIVKWKDAGNRPEWPAIAHLDSTTKAYWAQWDSLALREGVLYHRWESPERGEKTWQLVR